jgi:hypothetical protein
MFIKPLLLSLAICSIPFMTKADEPASEPFIFGIGTHQTSDPDFFCMLKEAGGMANRDDFTWAACETEKGVITVKESYIHYLDRCRGLGLTTICILDYGNKFYEGGGYPRDPESIEAFTRYAETVVKTFNGKVKFYQVWNEWDGGCGMKDHGRGDAESYVRLIASVYPRIKAIDPSIVVIANSVCTGDSFLKKTIDLGVLKYCDAIALHTYIYKKQGNTLEDEWRPRMENVDKMLREANDGREFPLYITEVGWPTHVGSHGATEEYSADSMARVYLHAISLPFIKGVWWYDFRDDGWDPKYNEYNFGMLRNDFTPKLSYFVYRDLTQFLKGASFVERIDAKDPKVWVMKYKKQDGKTVLALWSEYKDIDPQLTLDNPNAAGSEFTLCRLGNGSMQRNFVKNPQKEYGKFSLVIKGARPWLMEGDLGSVQVVSMVKREFPAAGGVP